MGRVERNIKQCLSLTLPPRYSRSRRSGSETNSAERVQWVRRKRGRRRQRKRKAERTGVRQRALPKTVRRPPRLQKWPSPHLATRSLVQVITVALKVVKGKTSQRNVKRRPMPRASRRHHQTRNPRLRGRT
eukprot:Rmarinus@m.27304